MHVWPISSPQSFTIPKRTLPLDNSTTDGTDTTCEPELQRPNPKDEQVIKTANELILQSVSVSETNSLILLTSTRVLLYNFKPLAPTSTHERSLKSIENFGANKFIIYNSDNETIKGITANLNDTDGDGSIMAINNNNNNNNNGNNAHRRVYFYVVTDKNYILVYQIATRNDAAVAYKEYGMLPKHKILMPQTLQSKAKDYYNYFNDTNVDEVIANDIDDEVLTVFSQQNNKKVIQNGYSINRQRNIFQMLINSRDEISDEMPIKASELRLKCVLKFDHEILQGMVFRGSPNFLRKDKHTRNNMNSSRVSDTFGDKRIDHLFILFSHEVHLLTLENFKLKSNESIKIRNGIKLITNNGYLFVLSRDKVNNNGGNSNNDNYKLFLSMINTINKTVYTNELNIQTTSTEQFINAYSFGNDLFNILLSKEMILYDVRKKEIVKRVKFNSKITRGGKLTDDVALLTTEYSGIQLVSKYGNILFTFENEIEKQGLLTSFSYMDQTIITTFSNNINGTMEGTFQVWNCWQEISAKQISNLKVSGPYVLNDNKTNSLLIFQSTSIGTYSSMFTASIQSNGTSGNGSYNKQGGGGGGHNNSNNNSNRLVLRLPTKSINNYVSLTKLNGSLTKLACFVANKDILLICDFKILEDHSGGNRNWQNFQFSGILDMEWIGDKYLLIAYTEDYVTVLKCYDIEEILRVNNGDMETGRTWSYVIKSDEFLASMSVNTLNDCTVVRKKKTSEILYKTAEICLCLGSISVKNTRRIEQFDVLSDLHLFNVNTIVNHRTAAPININKDVFFKYFRWIYRHKKNQFVIYNEYDELLRLDYNENTGWEFKILYSNVERIVDFIDGKLCLIKGNELIITNLSAIIDSSVSEIPLLVKHNIYEEEYPILLNKECTIFQSLQCAIGKYHSGLSLHDGIVLDGIIESILEYLSSSVNDEQLVTNYLESVTRKYSYSKHYLFALEKVLSFKILNKQDLSMIMRLINLYDEANTGLITVAHRRLEIISNCLRKIEIRYWKYFFESTKITPKTLISDCIKLNNAKTLGVLLMVFLNYNEDNNADSASSVFVDNKDVKNSGSLRIYDEEEEDDKNTASAGILLKDQTLVKQVLKILVNAAVSTAASVAANCGGEDVGTEFEDEDESLEYWNLSFQLIRFLKTFDKENGTKIATNVLDYV
ncbi:Ric1p SCDLUD_002430 [Saccharomycodes ludwigii]|uniref:Ric1p n=1 Tax=Saccharomycodes ludwigii TaxID=36035 RepID=UPI001E848531|nr:hypothetical protein SCDLUD_002430 [Saccharomycodes ludwigii]KAH3900967.1 hypothetical protein SCDLUD_002430 [Saccharomycodes ludwigii]